MPLSKYKDKPRQPGSKSAAKKNGTANGKVKPKFKPNGMAKKKKAAYTQ